MNIQILGVGTAVPAGSVTQQDAARLALETVPAQRCDMTATLPALYEHTTIRTRHSVLVDSSSNGHPATQSFFPAGHERRATADRRPLPACNATKPRPPTSPLGPRPARWPPPIARPRRSQHLVTVSCSGFSAPGVDVGLIERLGLRRDVSRTHVGFMGCHGAMNGLRVAAALAKSQPASKVLLVLRRNLQHPSSISAAVRSHGGQRAVQRRRGSDGRSGRTSRKRPMATCRSAVARGAADSADVMTWRIGDHGFEMTLSADVPTIIREIAARVARGLALRTGSHASTKSRLDRASGRAAHSCGLQRGARTCRPMRSKNRTTCSPSTATCRRRRCCSFSTACGTR